MDTMTQNITTPQQPTPTSTPPVSPVVPISKSKNYTVVWIVAGAVTLAIGIGVGLMLGKYSSKPKQITSYEECVKANGNQITLMYPGTCTTRDGKQFTQPTPTPLPSETSAKEGDPIANWKTYENTKFAYSIKYPPSLTPLETTSDIYLNQVAFNGPEKTYLSGTIVEVRDLTNLEDEISYRTWRIVGHIAEKLDSEIPVTISGLPGKRLNYTSGQKQFSIVILPYRKLVYSIEAESNLLDQILSTFKFVGQNVAQ